MTLSTSGYTVGPNEPLNHARILWQPITGTVTADGSDGNLAVNDYTNQRWTAGTLPSNWTLVTGANAEVDTVFIAAHNLGSTGSTVAVQTAATVGGAFTTRATVAPTDDSTIAVMFNFGSAPYVIREIRLAVTGSSGAVNVGIIRAGVALQMERPVFGGATPLGLNRVVETRQSISETGQWLGLTVQIQAQRTSMDWQHLSSAWYRANFQPFALSLPHRPFGLIQNPLRMPESVGWCWVNSAPAPANMGVRDLMAVQLDITGFIG